MKKNKHSAWVKAMDYLARRDHSEKELREKMLRHFSIQEVEEALTEVKERGWLPPPEELSERVLLSMNRKNKSIHYINSFLRKKGLPPVPKDPEEEIRKAMYLLENLADRATDRKRQISLLKNRGFDKDIIQKVVYETFENP